MAYSDLTIWLVIVVMAAGTFLLRWSFLGAVGNRPIPPWAQRLLRYTAVAVLPALVAPAVMWPQATGGRPDPVRMATAAATVLVGLATRNTLAAIVSGISVLALGTYLVG